jgi:hypothetical protein
MQFHLGNDGDTPSQCRSSLLIYWKESVDEATHPGSELFSVVRAQLRF